MTHKRSASNRRAWRENAIKLPPRYNRSLLRLFLRRIQVLSQKDVATLFDVTRQQISFDENRALKKLLIGLEPVVDEILYEINRVNPPGGVLATTHTFDH